MEKNETLGDGLPQNILLVVKNKDIDCLRKKQQIHDLIKSQGCV